MTNIVMGQCEKWSIFSLRVGKPRHMLRTSMPSAHSGLKDLLGEEDFREDLDKALAAYNRYTPFCHRSKHL